MALNLESKKAIVAEVSSVATKAVSLVAANYRGLTVAEMTELRGEARKSNVYLRVVRNTLAKRALENTDYDCVCERLTGPLILAFSEIEPSAAARLVRDFSKNHQALDVQFLSVSKQLLEAKDLGTLAKLPTRDEAISQLMSVMQAPISKLVATIAEPTSKMVRTVAAVKDQKQAAA